ncbi:MAG: lipoate--protein ligase [Acidaminococcaceae bacterium]|nr:lipoate--protein ligase [Acidaminococcaceae bacterium]HCJ90319.1 lipoate--protein ligase [Acidaminococcaceae bacterium]
MNRPLFLESTSHNPYWNLATERILTEQAQPGAPALFLWSNTDTVVIGLNQDCRAECKVDSMRAEGIFLMRRFSGGGAVWHDLGNVNFSFCCHDADYDVDRQTDVVLRACRKVGIDAVRTGRNDLEAAGCKFSGNAYYQVPGGHCQHGTLLVHCNMSRLGEYLTVSPEKLKKHAVSSVRSRVVNLADLVPGVTIPRLSAALQEAFEAEYGPAETGRLPDRERVEACAALLRSDDWIYGRRIPATQTWKGSFPWGHFELHLVVQQGLIRDARAVTDMLDSSIPHAFAAALIGEPCLPGRLVEAARRAGGDAFAKDMAGLACTQD